MSIVVAMRSDIGVTSCACARRFCIHSSSVRSSIDTACPTGTPTRFFSPRERMYGSIRLLRSGTGFFSSLPGPTPRPCRPVPGRPCAAWTRSPYRWTGRRVASRDPALGGTGGPVARGPLPGMRMPGQRHRTRPLSYLDVAGAGMPSHRVEFPSRKQGSTLKPC